MEHASIFNGCYEASRAAALSGVPKSTVYLWARQGLVVPSVSPVQEKLWSYGDLIALRIVSWLRHNRVVPGSGTYLAASPMSAVRRALGVLEDHDLSFWDSAQNSSPLLVDGGGKIYVQIRGKVADLYGAPIIPGLATFGLTRPFALEAGRSGPDLIRPRPQLRILPGKVSGEPHIAHTRVTSLGLAALRRNGFPSGQIADMYELPINDVEEALDLEQQLGTLAPAAA